MLDLRLRERNRWIALLLDGKMEWVKFGFGKWIKFWRIYVEKEEVRNLGSFVRHCGSYKRDLIWILKSAIFWSVSYRRVWKVLWWYCKHSCMGGSTWGKFVIHREIVKLFLNPFCSFQTYFSGDPNFSLKIPFLYIFAISLLIKHWYKELIFLGL